jgi:hypothetical protein
MATNAFLRGRQAAKNAESTRVRNPSQKKRANDENPPSARRKSNRNTVPDIDAPIHPDSTVSLREAMGPVFKDTFARIDAMNAKEEQRFLLVAETFLGSQRVLSVTKQFGIGEWNCVDYFTQANQKLEENASKRGIDSFTRIKSKANVSAKNMPAAKHINADVEDPDDWTNVEESVQFLMESKMKGIRVDFKMQYDPVIEEQEEEQQEDSEDEVEIIEPRAPKKVLSFETLLMLASYSYNRFNR